MSNRFTPDFKSVEINQSVGLRTGHMLAQYPLSATEAANSNIVVTVGNYTFFENGHIMVLAQNGGELHVETAPDTALAQDAGIQLYLHYTEELNVEGNNLPLNKFAEEVIDGIVYPRCIALYPGDQFTTDKAPGITARFFEEDTTMPDGVTAAKRYTFIG